MSTELSDIPEAQAAAAARRRQARYRAVSLPAVLSVVCGVLGIVVFFDWLFVIVPLGGILLGWIALRRIGRRSGELTGSEIALAGIGLSIVTGVMGAGFLLFSQRLEVPLGYTPLTWEQLAPDPNKPSESIPPPVEKLEKELVFVKGYIYPGRQVAGIKKFVFVPTENHCQFCTRQLKSTEMILVSMAGDLTAEYTARLVGVGGRLKLDREEARNPYGGFPYQIECDCIR